MSDASIPAEVAALAAEVQSYLACGDLDGSGPVELASGDRFEDSGLAARIVLADVEHCAEIAELVGSPPDGERWRTLAADLCVLRSVAAARC